MDRIRALHDQGQSIWFDFIERSMLHSGDLQTLVDEGVVGVTSNPSIFQNAISGSDAYVDDLARLAASGNDAKAIYEALAIADIQTAADTLRPVYDQHDGQDGFVSLEVAPDLAYDTEATIVEAKRLHEQVNRPNLMIKVPATLEGLPAVRELIRSGINVNVTLIFSSDRYEEVMEAYILGLEDRLSAGQSIDRVASVASFFVSRVDVSVDAKLEQLAAEDAENAAEYRTLQGKTAVANAKLAYRRFEKKFDGPRWARLAEAGASVQRPLWASTGTKNPEYPDLLYVEILVGPHTVNTMPPATLDAFKDHGEVALTVNQNVDLAVQQIEAIEGLGISIEAVTDQLEEEGVAKFAESFVALLETIDARSQELARAS
jgi:transaldolase